MSDLKDHRYRVSVLKIERTDSGQPQPFFDGLTYFDFKYDQIVGIQAILEKSNVEDLLVQAGLANAKAEGFEIAPGLLEMIVGNGTPSGPKR